MGFIFEKGSHPVIAVALHGGHEVRDEIRELLALDDATRLREEDPFTDLWTDIVPTRFVATRSRFEVDLNRARSDAVYRTPAEAWGMEVWKQPPAREVLDRSRALHDRFYTTLHRVCSEIQRAYGRFVVLDLHSYNHRRSGPGKATAGPEVDVGTDTMDRNRWAPLVDRFIADLRAFDFLGRRLDVGENQVFPGEHLVRYIHAHFPETGCALSVEVKKFFMDEWTGTPDRPQVNALRDALKSTLPGILESLRG